MQLQDLTTREFPLERIGRSKVPPERRWQINAVWDLEFEQVKRWLEHQARFRTTNTDHGQNINAALTAGPALSDEVAAIFAASPAAVDPVVLRAAHLGELQKAAPSLRSLNVMRIIKIVAAVFETVAFLQATGWKSLADNYILLILGPLLAVLAWLCGYGLARILMAREQGMVDTKGRLGFVVGAAGILVAVGARFFVGSVGTANKTEIIGATLLPVLLALAIATLEAIEFPQRRLYEGLHEAMFESQSWFATQKHAAAVKNTLYESMFSSILNRISFESVVLVPMGAAQDAKDSPATRPAEETPMEATESTLVPPTPGGAPTFSARLTLKEKQPNVYHVVPEVVEKLSDDAKQEGDENS